MGLIAIDPQEASNQEDVPLVFTKEDEADVKYPQQDALLVTVMIKHVQIQKIFVNISSSDDILYFNTYTRLMEALSIKTDLLSPTMTSLKDFTGHSVRAKGVITLPVTVGDTDVQRTVEVRWLVVDLPSAYNAILGRPTLIKMKAVISQHHLMIKFPFNGKVGKMFGDQEAARQCSLVTI